MKILVTGGCGFIGAKLVAALQSYGHKVVISDLKEGYTKAQDLTLTDLKDVSLIFHLGAIPRVGVSLTKPEEVLKNNVDSTLHLLELCRLRPQTALVFASSSSVQFANTYKNPYAMSKKIGEDYVLMYRQLYNVQAATVRFFNVYGDGESDYGDYTTVIQQCKDRMLKGYNPVIYGDGKIARDFTHVDDVVSGLLEIGSKVLNNKLPIISESSGDKVWELGNGNPISILDIAKEFVRDTHFEIVFKQGRLNEPNLTRSEKFFWPSNWSPQNNVLIHIRKWKAQNLTECKGKHLTV